MPIRLRAYPLTPQRACLTVCAHIIMRETDAPPPTTPDDPGRRPYVIGSALRTLEVLQTFARPPHRFGLAEIVESMGLERNQAYRSLKTLEAAGMLVLGGAVVSLAATAARGRSVSLIDIARPFLDDLARATNETVHLFVRDGDHASCVDRRESPQGVRLASALGQSVPLHAGAVPKAMLAFVPPPEREDVLTRLASLPRYTDRTELDPRRLERELALVRSRGYSTSDEDYDLSAGGVGAPVFAGDGVVVAGISVGGPSFRIDDDVLASFAKLVRAAAEGVTRQLALTGRS